MIRYERLGHVWLLVFDEPPPCALRPESLDALRTAVDRLTRDAPARSAVLIGREDHFSAGADVELFRRIGGAGDAMRLSQVFQEAFQFVEDSPKPIVAAVAGRVLGGALELAMACHARVAAEGATLGLPEVKLGINPGAGGTQRLPRLIGLGAALDMLLEGRSIGAGEALRLGLIDAVAPLGELREQGLRLAEQIAREDWTARRTTRRTDRLPDAAAIEAMLDQADRRAAAQRIELLAPRTIVRAVRAGLTESVAAGMAAEQQGFAECMDTLAAQNRIYLFFATRAAGRLDVPPERPEASALHEPAATPEPAVPGAAAEPDRPAQLARGVESDAESLRPVQRVGVVGLGTMGAGISQALATAGLSVRAVERDLAALRRAMERVDESLRRRVARGRIEAHQADRILASIAPSDDVGELGDCDLVVEAVWEDLETKRALLERLEAVCPPRTILATNTSTLPLAELAATMRRPSRLVGMHFFHPAQRMPLVEVIRGDASGENVVAAVVRLVRRLGKTPVVVADAPGFLVNRMFIPYVAEAFRLWQEGAAPEAIDAAMVEFGMAMGPLATIDFSGLDVLVRCERILRARLPELPPPSPLAERLVEAGHLGQKTGAGVYSYRAGDYTPYPHAAALELAERFRRETGCRPRMVHADEIVDRLARTMVAQACDLLRRGVARRESDIDVASVLGIGFPDFRGGVLRCARQAGWYDGADAPRR